MDIVHTEDSLWKGGSVTEAKINKALSMEDLITSMRSHLLTGGGGGEGADFPTTTSLFGSPQAPSNSAPPLCSSPINAGDYPVDISLNVTPPEDNFCSQEVAGLTGGAAAEEAARGPVCCQGSPRHTDGQFTASDLPLSNGFRDNEEEDSETVDVDGGHPRLRSTFYMRLREKYPRAFQRRSSITSDTTSVCSEVGPFQLARTMSPMPKGHQSVRPSHEGHGPPGEGLPPPPHSAARRVYTASSEYYEDKSLSSVTSYVREDLTITGSSRKKGVDDETPPMRSTHSATRTLSTYQIQGILKKDLESPNVSITSEPASLGRPDSKMSLKERLHQNKATLRALLSEENNPLRKRKVRTQAELNKSFESDITLEGDLSLSIETDHRHLLHQGVVTGKNGLLQIQTRPDAKDLSLGRSLGKDLGATTTVLSQRSLADRPQRKHVGTKRYISPDSSHDSAVDMDTASLQSSPGSSDTQTTVITRMPGNQRPRHHGNGMVLPPNGLVANHRTVDVVDSRQVSPRETQLHQAGGHHDYHLPLGGAHNSKGDSDVDSGIAHGAYPATGGGLGGRERGHRDRHDSCSSTENDPELDALHAASRVQNGSRFTTLSSQDIRSAHKTRQVQMSSGGKYGPLKADHTIQPSSPMHFNREELQEYGSLQPGHSRKSASTQDLSQKRVSLNTRVRFEDEVGEQPLGLQQRAMSHPELSTAVNGADDNQPETQIPSGCRALKLRGARRAGRSSNSSPVSMSSSQLDMGVGYPVPQPPTIANNNSHHQQNHSEYDGNKNDKIGLPPSGRTEDLKTRMQRLRTRSRTPTEVIHAAASDARSDPLTSVTLPVHRASPVIIAQNGSGSGVSASRGAAVDDAYLSDTLSSENDLHDEVAHFNGFNDAWTNALAVKKSKKPWKKNRGQYNPSDYTQEYHQNPQQKERARSGKSRSSAGSRRPSSGLSERYADGKHAQARTKKGGERPASCTAEINHAAGASRLEGAREGIRDNPYEEVGSLEGPGRGRGESDYEEVRFHRQDTGRDIEDAYAVPQKPPKGKSNRTSKNPCVVNAYDDSICQEEAPPIPERGYTSDLERYKDLSGSRTSLSGKMDSFRRAAKNKWSALRRAVSLERVDKAGADDGGLARLKKSPSLQSLAKKLSFKKKDKAKFSDDDSGLPPSPHHRPTRPQSASFGRSRKHSASLTSLSLPVDAPQNFRPIGKLKQLNPDGSQILELVRPPHGPFGFYIARGNVKYGGGVFVSRLSDGLPEHFFAGLLGVGDEILEINCQLINNLTLDEVYTMMAQRHHLLIKTLPYMARKDT